jgi:hypothetical protein
LRSEEVQKRSEKKEVRRGIRITGFLPGLTG